MPELVRQTPEQVDTSNLKNSRLQVSQQAFSVDCVGNACAMVFKEQDQPYVQKLTSRENIQKFFSFVEKNDPKGFQDYATMNLGFDPTTSNRIVQLSLQNRGTFVSAYKDSVEQIPFLLQINQLLQTGKTDEATKMLEKCEGALCVYVPKEALQPLILNFIADTGAIQLDVTAPDWKQKYGMQLRDIAISAGFERTIVDDIVFTKWNVHTPLANVVPTKGIMLPQFMQRMMTKIQKEGQEAMDRLSENLDKYAEARDALKRERITEGSKIKELVAGEEEKNPASASSFLEQFYAYSIETAKANTKTVPELYSHLNSNELDYKLFTNPQFYLKTPPIFVQTPVA